MYIVKKRFPVFSLYPVNFSICGYKHEPLVVCSLRLPFGDLQSSKAILGMLTGGLLQFASCALSHYSLL